MTDHTCQFKPCAEPPGYRCACGNKASNPNVRVMRRKSPVQAGDVARSITKALHIPHCGGCGKRQADMNEASDKA